MISDKCEEVYRELRARGFDEGLCREIAYKHMNTDYTATRMLGYLYRQSYLGEEELIDEMLAILSDRDSLVKKHEAEHAQARINEIYQYGLDGRQISRSREDLRLKAGYI